MSQPQGRGRSQTHLDPEAPSPHQRCVDLRQALPEAVFQGTDDFQIVGCSIDCKRIGPNEAYAAVRNSRRDGHDFLKDAFGQGASAAIVERPCPEAGHLERQIVVPDARSALAKLDLALAGDPQRHLQLIGVAGTYGQRTATRFFRSIMDERGEKWGWIGPHAWSDGVETYPRHIDRRHPSGVARILAQLLDRGCRGAILEVETNDIAAKTCEGLEFDAMTVLHLDDHPGREVKLVREERKLFAQWLRQTRPGGAVIVNADDPDAEVLGGVKLDARRIAFGMEPPDIQIQFCGLIDWVDGRSSRIRLEADELGSAGPLDLTLPGRFAIYSALAAAAIASEFGASLEEIVAGLSSAAFPGMFEPVLAHQPFEVRVDSANQPGDVARGLLTLRELGASRALCVIGAPGGGKRSDRQAMAKALEFAADHVYLTTDNPKGEDPLAIARDLLAGFRDPNRVTLIPDRAAAIEAALAAAQPGDGVLIAGKGRASVQIFSHRPVLFDDAAIAERYLSAAWRKSRRSSA